MASETSEASVPAGSAAVQGDLWSARAQDWADVQELVQRPLYTSILQEVMQGSHVDLLDIGCGSGLFTAMAAAASRVSGIDAAGALLAIAKRRTPQADFRVGEMEMLPFDSRTFEVVTGINSFQFAAHPVNALREARRVGTPKGRVIIATWGRMEECDTAAYFDALNAPETDPGRAPRACLRFRPTARWRNSPARRASSRRTCMTSIVPLSTRTRPPLCAACFRRVRRCWRCKIQAKSRFARPCARRFSRFAPPTAASA